MNEWMNVFPTVLVRRRCQPRFVCSLKKFLGDKKYTFPTCLTARQVGMLVVGGFICYKDSTRRRVAEIP